MLIGDRPKESVSYWEWRMTDAFRQVDDLELEISRLYAKAYESIWKEFEKLTAKYRFADGTLDVARFEMASKFDAKLNREAARQFQFLNNLDETINKLGKSEIQSIEELLMQIYKKNYYQTLFEMESGLGYRTEFALVSPERLKQVVHTKWSEDGIKFSDRIWRDKYKLNKDLRAIIQDGFFTGKSRKQMATILHKDMSGALYNSKRIIRTECAAIITKSDLAAYEEIGFGELIILSTFDKRTSKICAKKDGTRLKLSEAKIATNVPPFHPNCRTTVEPYMKETTSIRYARGIDGKRVLIPTTMTYEEFKRLHLIN